MAAVAIWGRPTNVTTAARAIAIRRNGERALDFSGEDNLLMPPKVIHKSAISTDSHTGLIECEDLNLIDRMEVTLKRIAAKDH